MQLVCEFLSHHGFDPAIYDDELLHTFIRVDPHLLVPEAKRLKHLLEMAGVVFESVGPDMSRAGIQANYDPTAEEDEAAFILLTGVSDTTLNLSHRR